MQAKQDAVAEMSEFELNPLQLDGKIYRNDTPFKCFFFGSELKDSKLNQTDKYCGNGSSKEINSVDLVPSSVDDEGMFFVFFNIWRILS